MNVFDYWIDSQNEDDSKWENKQVGWWQVSPADRGVNANHTLKFHRYDSDVNAAKGDLNSYLGGRVVNQGIVQNTLGSDGYPVLSAKNGGESLAYLFNPNYQQNGKASYTGATHLFQQDEDGYYFYNSADNWAMFDKNSRRFTVSTLPDDASHDIDGTNEATYYGFFPFDPTIAPQYHSKSHKVNGQPGNYHNHYFGVTMTTPFTQPYGGMVEKSDGTLEPMSFEFSGDDDVWVYIDGVLVGDLGGIHGVSTLDIDFSTGVVKISDVGSKGHTGTYTLRDLYRAAGREGSVAWNGNSNTFSDYSTHTMNFFYMERGNQLSNMKIKYNLVGGGSISAQKTLTSGNTEIGLRQGQFQYELRGYYDGDSAPVMPIGIPKSRVSADETGRDYTSATVGCAADGSVNFGSMQLGAQNAGKTYRYSVREVIPADATDNGDGTFTKDGVVYDGSVHYLVASVIQGIDGSYSIQKTWYSNSGFSQQEGSGESYTPHFSNSYKSGNNVDLQVKKALVGDELQDGQFTFVLTDSNGNPVGKETNGADGIAHFSVPGFLPSDFNNQDGTITRTYTISEQVPEGAQDNRDGTYTKDGIIYASKPVTVSVTGTYNSKSSGDPITVTTSYDQGTLSATYEDGKIVASTSGITGTGITGTATIEPITVGAPMPSSASVQIGADGKADFGTVDFSKADAGTYKYRVSAGSHVAELAVTIGSHETAIVPSFVQDEGRPSGTLSAKATGLGGTATISASEGAPLPQKSSAEVDEKGNVSFGTVDFSAAAAGTYTYTVTVGGKSATVSVTVSKETHTASGVSGTYALTHAGNSKYYLHVTANVGSRYKGKKLALSPTDNLGWQRATATVTNDGVADFGSVEWWNTDQESHDFTIRTPEDWNFTVLGSFKISGTSGTIGTQMSSTVTELSSTAVPFSETTSEATSASHEIAVAADIPTITNRAVVEVRAKKVWDDNGADSSSHPAVTFHLLQKVGDAQPTRVEGQDRTIEAGASGGDLTVTWRNLPKRDAQGNEIAYSVEEEPLSGYSSQVTGSMNDGFTVTNTPSFGFSLLKKGVSADGKTDEGPLSGAQFTIKTDGGYVKGDGSITKDEVTLTTDSDGMIVVSNKLLPGKYTITEITAPSGYQLPKGTMTLVIRDDGTADFTSLSGTKTTIPKNDQGQFSITVTDVKAVGNLPVTGGLGVWPLFLVGVAAVAAAVIEVGLSRRQ